jgi:D-sedoheptulose 7-phosphate isomerase
MDSWDAYVAAIGSGLNGLSITDRSGAPLGAAGGFARWVDLTHDVRTHGQNIFLVGNGASAAMASHFAADACKNGGLRAQAFNDGPLLTCTGNDLAFDEVFALPLARFGRAGDMLIAISSSGQSANILKALDCARRLQMTIVTVTGKSADNPSRSLGDLNIHMPSSRYGWVESGHHVVLHYWLDQYLDKHAQGAI